MSKPVFIDSLEASVDYILDNVAGDIVLGLPLGVGKPNPFVNALYRRIKANPTRKLRIITALSLEKPVGHSDLEKNFLKPLVDRVFADYPDLDYVKASRSGTLPPNIEVREFFMKTGDYLSNAAAQLSYMSTNYTFVARDMALQGLNVIAQAVAQQGVGANMRLSLSSNPDVTHEIIEKMRTTGQSLITVGMVNQQYPFMPNGAEVAPDFFDVVITDPAASHAVFAPPNAKVTTADYAIGMHASSLVEDGGTLQIGIGSLGDAIGHALIVRDRHGPEYQRILESLCPDGIAGRFVGRFDEGLYGCSEMFVNGFMRLIDAGIIRREVYSDYVLQDLCNRGEIRDGAVTPQLLTSLLLARRIHSPLREKDLVFLKKFGIFNAHVEMHGAELVCHRARCSSDLRDAPSFEVVCASMLGTHLLGGVFMTGGFFLGPRDFYERLRSMPAHELSKIDMTRIDFINQLYGDDALKRVQRIKARFINTTMKATLLGAVASDALESGQVVSGVGGQYNFVAMAHALPDARLLMLLRATHDNKDGLTSSIVWNYGNVTIPRHLRDIIITEYGVADLRGQIDSEVVKRLIAVSDSRFQDQLIKEAKAHGKLEADYVLPERYRDNLPSALEKRLRPWMKSGLLPDFPFGTDLTDDELIMVKAMKRMKHASTHPKELVSTVLKNLMDGKEAPAEYLQRLGLADATGFKDVLMRRLFAGSL
jgi:acyl-CoA hydrolase